MPISIAGVSEFVALTKAVLQEDISISTPCAYRDRLAQFIHDSCIPGTFEEENSSDATEKMCRLCKNSRDIFSKNRNYFNITALTDLY